jgi:hypothetical protein
MITQKENDGDFCLRILYSFFAVNGKQLLKEPYVITSAKTQIKKRVKILEVEQTRCDLVVLYK